jgi:hypothetical protein
MVSADGGDNNRSSAMSVKRSICVFGAFLFAATTAITFSNSARAETGLSWLDSGYAVPADQVVAPRLSRHQRRVSSAVYVPQAVQVAAYRNDCFWCNVRISGLGF